MSDQTNQDELQRLQEENTALRQLLCLRESSHPYLDDGEMSDSSQYPIVDFKRDSIEQMHAKLRQRYEMGLNATEQLTTPGMKRYAPRDTSVMAAYIQEVKPSSYDLFSVSVYDLPTQKSHSYCIWCPDRTPRQGDYLVFKENGMAAFVLPESTFQKLYVPQEVSQAATEAREDVLVPIEQHHQLTFGPTAWARTRVPYATFHHARGVYGTTSHEDDQQVYQVLQVAYYHQAMTAAPATFQIIDPDYARIYTTARCLAWSYGFACVVQGSLTRDLDLLLVPWTEQATDEAGHRIVKMILNACELKEVSGNPGAKPHGRRSYNLIMAGFADPRFIDISIVPCASKSAAIYKPT